ncbi:putative zinc-binding protein [Desulfospira joergensenii]|uniref:putative zinc-binding protein n=1 Tax=Desulfospira joergensenii TaxID=53329 RepID=UPI0003B7238A|nr:putative zinc-binding protein [Desulfospira joergensenii]
MYSDVSVKFENTGSVCPIGEITGKQMIQEQQIPVISCEGSCIRGEIARLAANMLAKQEGYGRGCHGEIISVPQSAMAKWAQQSDKVIVIDGCFLHCHGRILEGLFSREQLLIFDALSYYRKYTDIMDMDDVPEAERRETAQLVLENVLGAIENGLTPGCNDQDQSSCCTCAEESPAGCCGD